MTIALPQGYEPHELPADYDGPLFIEGQMQAYAHTCVNAALEQAEQECRKIADEAWDDSDSDFSLYVRGVSRGADKCADAIFAMKMK